MNAPNPNLIRWVLSSLCNHFNQYKGTYSLYIEGMLRRTGALQKYAELRIDGPNFYLVQKGLWHISCEVNILITSQASDANLYTYSTMCGHFASSFYDTISVLKYGSEVGDDQSYVGCLKLKYSKDEKLEVHHFGIIDPATNLQQGSIEGHYIMEFQE